MTRRHDVSALALLKGTNRTGFEKLIGPYFLPWQQRKIMQAYRLAKYGHQSQVRQGGGRYFEHPKSLALLLIRLGVRDHEVICAALLHDVVEDTFILELADIEEWFGPGTCLLVKLVTKEKGLSLKRYIERLTAGDPRAWLVKCADRVHNMSTLDSPDPAMHEFFRKKKIKQVKETREKILPLAVKLSAVPGFEELGRFFFEALNYWCERREREATEDAPPSD